MQDPTSDKSQGGGVRTPGPPPLWIRAWGNRYNQLRKTLGIYQKRLLQRCIHHFKSDLINDMDYMRITVSEPSLVILSQTK